MKPVEIKKFQLHEDSNVEQVRWEIFKAVSMSIVSILAVAAGTIYGTILY